MNVSGTRSTPRRRPLVLLRQFLPEFLEPLSVRIAGIDVAVVVHADAFEGAGVFGFLDEAGDLAVLGTADPDALLEARVGLVGRLRVGDVDSVVLVDPDAARPAELLPLGKELAILVEDLEAAIGAVGDEQAPGRIESEPVRHVEFARSLAFLAPRLDELAVAGEFDDAGVGLVAVPVGDENIAVRGDNHVGGRVEMGSIVAGLARRAKCHEHLAVRRELHDRVAGLLVLVGAPVGDPDVAVLIDEQAMREVRHPGAEARYYAPGSIVLVERRNLGALAAVAAAAVVDPHALAVAIDVEPDGGAVAAPHGLFGPAFIEAVSIGG